MTFEMIDISKLKRGKISPKTYFYKVLKHSFGMKKRYNLPKIIGNEIRLWTIGIVFKQPATISQIHGYINNLGRGYDYKAVHKQVMFLKEQGVVGLEKKEDKQGRPVYVTGKDVEFFKKFKSFLRLMVKLKVIK